MSTERRNRGGRYILVNGEPKAEPDLLKWANWYETADRIIARDKIGRLTVSTVFLGLDHRFTGSGRPILYETMVFTRYWNKKWKRKLMKERWTERSTSRAEALITHALGMAEALRLSRKAKAAP